MAINWEEIIEGEQDLKGLSLALLKDNYTNNAISSNLQEDVKYLKKENYSLKEENERLKALNQKLLTKEFGSKTEKTQNIKLQNEKQVFDEPEVIDAENLDKEDEFISVSSYTKSKKKRVFPSDIPRVTVIHELSEEERACPCGCLLEKVGEDKYTQIEYIPAKIRLIENIKYKYACKNGDTTMRTAKVPPQPIPKSMATASLIAGIIESKYCYHLPLYRQEKIWEARDINLPRGMLSSWILKVSVIITPIINLLKEKLLQSNYLQADETSVQVLKEEKKSAQSKSYIWVYKTGTNKNGIVIFEYKPNRKGENVNTFLEEFTGFLQSDGYAGYKEIGSKKEINLVGCWAHARRKFIDIVKSTSKKTNAETAVNYIGKLYKIEKQISDFTIEQKEEIRKEKSTKILNNLFSWMKTIYPKCPPKSEIAKALKYSIDRENELRIYTTKGFLNIDNNFVENKIRPFAIGRKNWLFMGNKKGAIASSNIYSLIETAKMNNLDPYKYFKYILEKIPIATKVEDFEKLLPTNKQLASLL